MCWLLWLLALGLGLALDLGLDLCLAPNHGIRAEADATND